MSAFPFDVIVVGAGVCGLTTAIALQRTARRVMVITADPLERTTSHVAAAAWYPTRVGPTDQALAWGERTFEVLASLADSHPEAGVMMRRTVMLYRHEPADPWWRSAVRSVSEARPDDLPSGYTHGLTFAAPLAEMPVYLPWLAGLFTSAGGVVRPQRLAELGDVVGLAPVIVNCSGLGARTLVGDTGMVAVRGQVVRTTNPGLTVSLRDEHHPDGYTYVHPRAHDCILGGTLDEDRWDLAPDASVADGILRRCRELVPALTSAEVLGHAVGLRPGRPTVRLEVDETAGPGTMLVHNYGHGGAGVTLSWGCAEEVVALVGSGSVPGVR